MTTAEMRQLLDKHEAYRNYLYVRGFCITNKPLQENEYPLYGEWTNLEIEGVLHLCT